MANSNTPSDAKDVVSVDREENLAAYDALPKRLRELVDASPENLDATQVLVALQRWGEANTYALCVKLLEQRYPGWKAEQK